MDIDAALAKLKAKPGLKPSRAGIFFSSGVPKVRGIAPAALEIIPMVDEITGGHIDKSLKSLAKGIRGGIRYVVESAVDAYADTLPLGYDPIYSK